MIGALIDAIGGDAVAALADRFGGRRLYIARRPSAEIKAAVGPSTAAALSMIFGGSRIEVPHAAAFRAHMDFARRSVEAERLLLAGKSFAAVSRATGLSRRTVTRRAENLIRNQERK